MRYLSVCSGIEAATVAWHPLGWEPVAFSEIEKFPSAVLQHHYPDTPNLGDMTRYKEWDLETGIDVLVGGTPCQSFSVAGLRAGLDDPRGNLALVFLGLVDRVRPRWVVWENVPGVLSSNGGRDFGAFLGGLAALGYGWAYRVLDAQYFGLAQRRKRVFVVGCLGNQPRAAAVLLERAGLRGDPAPRREAGEGPSGTLGGSSQSGGFRTTDLDNNGAFVADGVAHPLRGVGFDASEDGTGPGTPITPAAFNWQSGGDARGLDPKPVTSALSCQQTPASVSAAGVRRLTPRECERLQGFPDDYTRIPWRKKAAEDCPDGPRYKALGNSMAVPCMLWIGSRIAAVEAIA